MDFSQGSLVEVRNSDQRVEEEYQIMMTHKKIESVQSGNKPVHAFNCDHNCMRFFLEVESTELRARKAIGP